MAKPAIQYGWNDAAGRYIELRSGRFVSESTVRAIVDQTLDGFGARMVALTDSLRGGQLGLSAWQAGMAQEIKAAHLFAAAAARGGWSQLSPADYGRVGQRLRVQYAYLRNRALAIQNGTQRLDGSLIQRTRLYAGAARGTFHAVERVEVAARGFDQERNVLAPVENCPGCLAQTGRGWVALGELIPIGQRDCIANCRCTIFYRNSATGVTR